MESAQKDDRPIARNPNDNGLKIVLDDLRHVAGFRADNGFIFIFTSHGIETKIALTEDAFLAAVEIAEQLLANTAAPNGELSRPARRE